MRGFLAIGLLLLVPLPASGQAFSWFATTMSSAESAHAAVLVLPASSWVEGDSTAVLTEAASMRVAAARENGVRVIAAVSPNRSELAVGGLWEGLLDGLIVPGGSLTAPVRRPETSVIISASPDDTSLDGAVAAVSVGSSDWEALDSLFNQRAPTMESPMPASEVALVGVDAGIGQAFLPGSILLDGPMPEVWETALAFRKAHGAIASGIHVRLDGSPYAFYRGKKLSRDETDEVVVVLGATGRSRINVSAAFEDDEVVREAVSGQIALVSFGLVTFEAGASGLLLIEPVR